MQNTKQLMQISWDKITTDCTHLYNKIIESKFEPDLIVGILKGGIIPATILAYKLHCKLNTVGYSSYIRGKHCTIKEYSSLHEDLDSIGNILFVDDLSDTGDTFLTVTEKYSMLLKNKVIKTAALYLKDGTKFVTDFYITKYPSNVWLEFPLECNK